MPDEEVETNTNDKLSNRDVNGISEAPRDETQGTRLEFLLKLSDALRLETNPVGLQTTAMRLLAERLNVMRASYFELENDDDTFHLAGRFERDAWPMPERMRLSDFSPALAEGYRSGRKLTVSNTSLKGEFVPNPEAYEAIGVGAWAAVPLMSGGRLAAWIGVHSTTKREWSAADLQALDDVAERTWDALERARAEASLRESEERQAFLLKLSDVLRPLADPAEMRAMGTKFLAEHMGVMRASYFEIDDDQEHFVQGTGYEDGSSRLPARMRLSDFDRVIADAYRAGQTFVVRDTETDTRLEEKREAYRAINLRAWIATPLKRGGRLLSVLGVNSDVPRAWTDSEIRLVEEVGERIWSATARVSAEAALRESEERQAFLLKLSDAMRPLNDPAQIQRVAVEMTGKHFHADRVGFAEIIEDELVLQCDYTSGVRSIVGRYHRDDFGEGISKLYFESGLHVSNDVANDPQWSEEDRKRLLSFDIAAFLGSSLHRGNSLAAGFGIHQASPRVWTQAEIALAGEISDRIWTEMLRARAQEAEVVRARAEQKLHESEQNLYGVANVVPDLLWYSEPDGSTPWYNDRWLEYTGQTLEQAIGWGWADAIHPDDREGSARRYREAVEQGKPLQQEHRIRNAAGEYRWFLVRTEPFRDADGQATRIYGAATDIHDQRLAMEALREGEERQAFLDHVGKELARLAEPEQIMRIVGEMLGRFLGVDSVIVVDVHEENDRITIHHAWTSQGTLNLVGDHSLSDYVTPEYAKSHRAGLNFFVSDTETDPQTDAEAYRKIGIRSWISVPFLSGGRWVGYTGVTCARPRPWRTDQIELVREVSDRLFARIAKARVEAALRESEQRYHALFAASPVPFMVLSANPPDYTILAANDAYFAATKTTRESLIGRRLFDVFTDDPRRPGQLGSEALDISLTKVLATQKTDAMVRVRYDLVVPGGFEPHWWEAINAPMLDASGEVTTIIHQVQRVTELHLAEMAEQQHQERQAFLLKLSDALRTIKDPRKIQQTASRMLGERFGVNRALYAEIEGEGDTADAVINGQFVQGVAPVPDRVKYKLFTEGFPGELWRRGLPVIVEDSETDPRFVQAVREAWRTIDTRSTLAVPLVKGGRETVIFGLHNAEPRAWTEADVMFVTEAIERTWAATERAMAEDALRQSEEKYRTLFETMDQGYAEVELIRDEGGRALDHRVTLANPAYERASGIPVEKILGRPVLEVLPENDPWWTEELDRIVSGGKPEHFERENLLLQRWFEVNAVPRDRNHLVLLFDNITDRKRSEETLRDSEERFRLYVENVREYALVQTDLEGIITSWNPGAEGLFHYTSTEVMGKPFAMLLPDEDRHEGFIAREMAKLSEGKKVIDAHAVQRKDGSRFWAEWITEPVFDDAGKLRGTAKVMRDETERRKAQAALESSLAEKESLLSEVHHRVKNNLQVITSLLNLQSRGLKDEDVLTLFNETRNRVQSIASIHELLYRSSNFANVDLFAYAKQLVPSLVRFYGAHKRIQVHIEGEGAWLELERAVPFGLLLNELVSNCLKHGFPEAESGSLNVNLRGNSEVIHLTVADSGKGLPQDFQPDKQSSLGLKLVHILVRQLNGGIQFQSNAGTSVKVQIPVGTGTQPHGERRSTLQDTDR